jgi:hypothetical protein
VELMTLLPRWRPASALMSASLCPNAFPAAGFRNAGRHLRVYPAAELKLNIIGVGVLLQ